MSDREWRPGRCLCEHRDHFDNAAGELVKHGYSIPDQVTDVKTAGGTFPVCQACLDGCEGYQDAPKTIGPKLYGALAPPRCSEHKGRPELPKACHTCNRIEIKRDIVTRTVDALLAAGYELQVVDGDGRRPPKPTTDRLAILDELMQTDDDVLRADKDGKRPWIRFVYGNDGWDVICDYSGSLEPVLAPINAYADRLVSGLIEEEDGGEQACTDPRGHSFVSTGTNDGGDDPRWNGEGRSLCRYCGADGDA